jgi:hypothetical protein
MQNKRIKHGGQQRKVRAAVIIFAAYNQSEDASLNVDEIRFKAKLAVFGGYGAA